MKEIIQKKLKEIEKQEHVKIILAIESGSRAWGFESADSDYDVRFIYVREPEMYLRLDPVRDVIEWQLDEVFDISGWDIKKALQLLYKSNPTLFEWINSPIVYKETREGRELRELSKQYFDVKKSVMHYLNMTSSTFENYLQDERVKLKKYFYALRPILASEYALENKTQPPIKFNDLKDTMLEDKLKTEVNHLLELKMKSKETEYIPVVNKLNLYIKNKMQEINEQAYQLNDMRFEWDILNRYFLKLLNINVIN
ncbi:nucleotidyltransferase domain-containing protein [uncultured Solobacterium sp.]|jgi:ycgL|uniref:nucleotidyltransferase domain-containing protein n=1 Tax=uncultured Solobacterium sp. TaxID=747375 RepID=UPI00263184F0|nr:nucleotidyltransferase domain-containing protein [uncultured Solobacterium sp.]